MTDDVEITAILRSSVTVETYTVEAGPAETATFLRQLANRIEAGEGTEVLMGMWNTGHGEDWEWTFQVVIEAASENGSYRREQS